VLAVVDDGDEWLAGYAGSSTRCRTLSLPCCRVKTT
jgi:hypothetical protein